jgi:uncharacterized cupin superfamily protein
MTITRHVVAIFAEDAPASLRASSYPQPFAWRAGTGNGHCLVNETKEEVVFLEVGDRTPGDDGTYPDDDLKAILVNGRWKLLHKDGTPY